jgi:SMC interacting uncharacterized protein involved in chromosome segregation
MGWDTMTLDWNIRAGDVMVVVSLAGTCLLYATKVGRFAENMDNMKAEIKELKEVAKSLAVIITQQAVQTVRLDTQGERLNHLDDKIERIRRGEGLAKVHS